MGAWAADSFGNDDACDWAAGLEGCDDLSLVETTIDAALDADDDYLESPLALEAIAAIEALARLKGQWGERSAYTEDMDAWVERVRLPVPPALTERALRVLDRVMGVNSELLDLWEESDELDAWKASIADLRRRVAAG